MAGRNEGKIWERVTSLDLLRMLSDAIHALEQDSQSETDDPISEDASETKSHKEPKTFETSITGLTKPNVKSYSAALPLPTAVTSTISEKDFNELDSDIDATLQPNQSEKEAKFSPTFICLQARQQSHQMKLQHLQFLGPVHLKSYHLTI